MVEDEVRAAFARHEQQAPDVEALRAAIDQAVVRRRRQRFTARAAGVFMLVLALIIPGYGLRPRDASTPGELLIDVTGSLAESTVPDGPLNFLLLGVDAKGGAPVRADTIIIVHVPAGRRQAYLLSLPRDLAVDIPADPAAHYPGGKGKLSAAFYYGSVRSPGKPDLAGGAKLTSSAVTRLTGIRFQATAIVKFKAVREITDALGGVYMCLDQPVLSVHTKRNYPKGCRTVDGRTALDLLRQRYGLPGGAFDRDRHGRQFLTALLRSARSRNVLTDPARLDKVLRAASDGLILDTRGVELVGLVSALREIDVDDVVGVGSTADWYTVHTENGLRPNDPDRLRDLLAAFNRDQVDQWLVSHPGAVD